MGAFGMMKVVAPIQSREAPVKAGLMGMMAGAVFGEGSLSIRCQNGMNVRSEIGSRVLGEDRRFLTLSRDGHGVRAKVTDELRLEKGNSKAEKGKSHPQMSFHDCGIACAGIDFQGGLSEWIGNEAAKRRPQSFQERQEAEWPWSRSRGAPFQTGGGG